jgi:Domain of unknown function (DUF4253)
MNKAAIDTLEQQGLDHRKFTPEKSKPSVWAGSVEGIRAIHVWRALRAAYPSTGLWPLIRGQDWRIEGDEGIDAAKPRRTPSFAKLLDRELRRAKRDHRSYIKGPITSMDAATLAKAVDRSPANRSENDDGSTKPPTWPKRPPSQTIALSATRDLETNRVLKRVDLSLVRVEEPFEVFNRIGFGGYNACPPPHELCVWFREWHRRYGALPAAATAEFVECVVERPPATKSAAFEVAAEQWLLCDDIVSQGTGSVLRLAQSLWRSPTWFLWWD